MKRDSHSHMEVPDIEILGSGDLFFCLRKEKTSRSAAAPKQWIWPAGSCPDLLCAVSWWLEMRRAVGVDVSSKMWQLPTQLTCQDAITLTHLK